MQPDSTICSLSFAGRTFILRIFYEGYYMGCINDNQGYVHCIAGHHLAISAATFKLQRWCNVQHARLNILFIYRFKDAAHLAPN
eukprot:5094209-Pleurochrysis_carterae.AAC.1